MSFDTIVISGGSAKGILVLGALQAAHDTNLLGNVSNYIGTSAGAMSGYLMAIGYTPIEILVRICTSKVLSRMKEIDIHSLLKLDGGIPFSIIGDELDSMSIEKLGYIPTLAELRDKHGKTLISATYNKTERRIVYTGPDTTPTTFCTTAVRMSSSLPLLFEPCVHDNCIYLDGGVCDNFPIDIGDNLSKTGVLGLILGGPRRGKSPEDSENILEYLYDLLFIPTELYIEGKIARASDKCSIVRLSANLQVYEFDLSLVTIFDLFSDGYRQLKLGLKL